MFVVTATTGPIIGYETEDLSEAQRICDDWNDNPLPNDDRSWRIVETA